MHLPRNYAGLIPFLILLLLPIQAIQGQAVKLKAIEGAPPPPLQYHGLLPGKDDLATVKERLGEAAMASRWYNYKMYYPAEGRAGMWDIVHMIGNLSTGGLASIEAATIPRGYEDGAAIREKLGNPEYHLRMNTWQLLDYSERGLRFTLDDSGETTGVAYVPHGHRRVPEGERDYVDLRYRRPQPGVGASLDGLEAGATEVVITPTGSDWLGPVKYTVHDDMKSRILVLSKGDLAIALVGADVFGMSYPDVKAIRDGARELGVDYTLFGMSHNHAGGDTTGVYGFYPAEYIAHIQSQTIAGIKAAYEDRKPVGELLVAARELPMDGTRVMGLIRNARNPGVMDPTIATLQVLDVAGDPIATLVHFACHVESLTDQTEISADFPGYMCDQMMADGLGQAVFLNGALGGMVSGDNKARTQASSRDVGLRFAEIAGDLVSEGIPPATFDFYGETRRLELPLTNPGFRTLMDEGPRSLHDGRVITDMTYVKIGTAQFITLPGELLPEVSFEILEKMNGYPRMLVGLGNDQLGYIIPPYDFRDDYYEETMSVGPATAPQVRDMARRMLREAGHGPE